MNGRNSHIETPRDTLNPPEKTLKPAPENDRNKQSSYAKEDHKNVTEKRSYIAEESPDGNYSIHIPKLDLYSLKGSNDFKPVEKNYDAKNYTSAFNDFKNLNLQDNDTARTGSDFGITFGFDVNEQLAKEANHIGLSGQGAKFLKKKNIVKESKSEKRMDLATENDDSSVDQRTPRPAIDIPMHRATGAKNSTYTVNFMAANHRQGLDSEAGTMKSRIPVPSQHTQLPSNLHQEHSNQYHIETEQQDEFPSPKHDRRPPKVCILLSNKL